MNTDAHQVRPGENTTPWTLRYLVRYFSFNMFRRRPAMHFEGFNIHALEGAIHIARSISFVAVAAICIDKTNIFLTSPAICIVLTIRWSMPKAVYIVVQYIATMCASMHIAPINMSEDPCAMHVTYSVCYLNMTTHTGSVFPILSGVVG